LTNIEADEIVYINFRRAGFYPPVVWRLVCFFFFAFILGNHFGNSGSRNFGEFLPKFSAVYVAQCDPLPVNAW